MLGIRGFIKGDFLGVISYSEKVGEDLFGGFSSFGFRFFWKCIVNFGKLRRRVAFFEF